MEERIKELRISLGLNQAQFADRLGVGRSTIGNYESGSRVPLDTVITSICREFHVNRVWLETGEGEMFQQISRDDELAGLLGDLMRDQPDFRHRLITVLLRSTPEEWAVIEKKALELIEEMKKADPQ